ncbi:MAG: DUF2232 domain-containing protein [Solirubrobacterales bacterium]
MTRFIALPLAAGLLSALLFLSVAKGIALGILLSYVAPLPLFMAGLGLGIGPAVIAGAAGAGGVALAAGGASVLPYAIAVALPAMLVTERALLWRTLPDGSQEWFPPGLVLARLTAAGLALILIGTALVSDHPDGVRGWVAELIGRTLEMMAPEVTPERRQMAVEWWTPLFPAMVLASWQVMAVVNATAAQALLVRMGHARRPTPAYRELWLPDWLGVVLAASAATAVLAQGDPGYVAANLTAVVLVPFSLLGLAGVHRWAAGRPHARLALAVTYGLLVLAQAWAAMAVAGLGVVRFWSMRFRRGRSGGGEEE